MQSFDLVILIMMANMAGAEGQARLWCAIFATMHDNRGCLDLKEALAHGHGTHERNGTYMTVTA